MAIAGTEVTFEERDGNFAMSFTATPDEVDEVRARARSLWTVYNTPPGILEQSPEVESSLAQAGSTTGPTYSTEFEQIRDGAQITFQPISELQRDRLRERVHAHVEVMAGRRTCPGLNPLTEGPE